MRPLIPPVVVATIAAAGAIFVLGARPAQSQTRPVSNPIARVDTTVIIGWLNVDKAELQEYDNWYSAASAGGSVGWYWTDHLKTELEYVVSSQVERDVYSFRQVG